MPYKAKKKFMLKDGKNGQPQMDRANGQVTREANFGLDFAVSIWPVHSFR